MAVIVDGFEIDCAINLDHAFNNDVTEHPVEVGADITDHVRPQPITITLSGIVSDTPIGEIATTFSRSQEGALPSDDAFTHFLRMRDNREPVVVETPLRTFEDMILQSLSVPQTARDGDSFRFSATFIQVQLVTNERTTVRVELPRAKAKVNRGDKPPTPEGFKPLNVGDTVIIDGQPATVVSATPGAGLQDPATARKPIRSGRGPLPVPPPNKAVNNVRALHSRRVPIASGGS